MQEQARRGEVDVVTGVEEAQARVRSTRREPFVLRGFELGDCLRKWTDTEYLQRAVGHKPVKIHVASADAGRMDFLNKNFLYRTLPFDELVRRADNNGALDNYFVDANEKYYLRSLGDDDRKDVADIKKQFPQLVDDIHFPPLFDPQQFFSSVFRISSANIRLWTHYDIMDNVLIQVTGRKRVVLFPPSDIDYMYMQGDKSQVIDIDEPNYDTYPLFAHVTRYECELVAGDCLFIPALWFHNVIALSFSIGVNVFWRHLSDECYEKRDVYGNKDLVSATRAFMFVDKAIKELASLNEPNTDAYRHFYTRRAIQMLEASLSQTT